MSQFWKESVLERNSTVDDVVRCLESAQLKIILVINPDHSLAGTITDGDVRRGLLLGVTMSDGLETILNTQPVVAFEESTRSDIHKLMESADVREIPILDSKGRILRVDYGEEEFVGKRKNPVVIMAGGFGRRLHPLTLNVPKPMLPVGGRPILESIILQLGAVGLRDIFISTHYQAEAIHKYFNDGRAYNVNIKYIHEKEPLGTAGALGHLPGLKNESPILVMNGDILTTVDFERLLSFHEEQGNAITVCGRDYAVEIPYGLLSIVDQQLTKMTEKPVKKFFVNAGIYVINTDICRNITQDEPMDMPYLINRELNEGNRVGVFPIHEYWLDIGKAEHLEQAKTDALEIFDAK